MAHRKLHLFTADQHGKLNLIRDKKADEYKGEFKSMPQMNTYAPNRKFQGWSSNQSKNRYKNIMCIDESRVQLSTGEYLHANILNLHGKSVILAQGPMAETCDAFWRAIFEKNVPIIFMLCQPVENGTPKCHQYFPTTNSPMKLPSFIVRTIRHQYVDGKRYFIKRTLSVEHKQTHQIHGLIQYQMLSWPDHGIPTDNSILNYMIDKLIKCTGTSLIHCSAGIGRTGTLVAAAFSYLEFKNEVFESVENVVKIVRESRCQSVQTPQQYWLVHMLFVEAIERNFVGGGLSCRLTNIKTAMRKELEGIEEKKK